jgi:hypothetical protein
MAIKWPSYPSSCPPKVPVNWSHSGLLMAQELGALAVRQDVYTGPHE